MLEPNILPLNYEPYKKYVQKALNSFSARVLRKRLGENLIQIFY